MPTHARTPSPPRQTRFQNLKLDFEELLYYQQQFKELLGFHVIVQYSKSKESGEIRINFKNEKDLDYLLDKMV